MSSTSLWYATRASGIMALILLTLTMVLGMTTTTRARARNWPGFAEQELHRRISMIAVVFLGIHIVTSVLDTYVNISWASVVVPFVSVYGRFWVGVGAIALDLMIAVFVTSLLRARMRPGTWRAIHWLAYLSWPVALAHSFGMGTDAGELWVIVLGVACVASVAAALAVAAPGHVSSGLGADRVRVGSRSAAEAPRAGRPGESGIAPCLARAGPSRRPAATGSSAIRPTWRGTCRRWAPSRSPRVPGAGVKPSCPCSSPPVWRAAAAPGSRPPSSWPWHTPRAAAAPSSSTAWRVSPRVTRTSCS